MRAAIILLFLITSALAAPIDKPVGDVAARQGDEDDGVGWTVAVPALMKPAPGIDLGFPNIPIPAIPGIPCGDKKKKY